MTLLGNVKLMGLRPYDAIGLPYDEDPCDVIGTLCGDIGLPVTLSEPPTTLS